MIYKKSYMTEQEVTNIMDNHDIILGNIHDRSRGSQIEERTMMRYRKSYITEQGVIDGTGMQILLSIELHCLMNRLFCQVT